jgi:hypothetical protein
MKTKKAFLSVAPILCILMTVFIYLTAWALNSPYPKFDVCIANETNIPVKYKREWCTRDGRKCADAKLVTVQPGNTMTHTSPEGMAVLHISIHTGGPKGFYKPYTIEGETEGCKKEYAIRAVEGGHLRIFKIK